MTIVELLTHSAGWPPDPTPDFWNATFGCPQYLTTGVTPETLDCVDKAYSWVMLNQTLENVPGTKFVYSDLSMITMAWIVGKIASEKGYITKSDWCPKCTAYYKIHHTMTDALTYHCSYEAYVRTHVHAPLKLSSTQFLLPQDDWARTAPCENYTAPNDHPIHEQT